MVTPPPLIEIPTAQEIDLLAVHAGISVAEACRRAKVSPEAFTRWRRAKTAPSIESVRAVVEQLKIAQAAREGARSECHA